MKRIERALVSVDHGPPGGLLRLTAGYLIVPCWSGLLGQRGAGWSLVLFFLFVLLALRLAPAVLRKLVPFDGSVRAVWAERRQLAKRFDSYQWQKLFWIGLGLALYTLRSGRRSGALLTLMFACVSSGAVGLVIWRYHEAQRRVQELGNGDPRSGKVVFSRSVDLRSTSGG